MIDVGVANDLRSRIKAIKQTVDENADKYGGRKVDGELVSEMHAGTLALVQYLAEAVETLLDAMGPPPLPAASLPHSRACGPFCRGHGPECHSNCPTCGGKARGCIACEKGFIRQTDGSQKRCTRCNDFPVIP